jgi:hypothetical protein
MNLAHLRSKIQEAESAIDAHTAAARCHVVSLRARVHAAWPWLWLGSGATLGVIAERRTAMPPAPRDRPAGASHQTALSLFSQLPWGLLLAVVDRAMALSERSADPDRASPKADSET